MTSKPIEDPIYAPDGDFLRWRRIKNDDPAVMVQVVGQLVFTGLRAVGRFSAIAVYRGRAGPTGQMRTAHTMQRWRSVLRRTPTSLPTDRPWLMTIMIGRDPPDDSAKFGGGGGICSVVRMWPTRNLEHRKRSDKSATFDTLEVKVR